jgi:hypothetical protein
MIFPQGWNVHQETIIIFSNLNTFLSTYICGTKYFWKKMVFVNLLLEKPKKMNNILYDWLWGKKSN